VLLRCFAFACSHGGDVVCIEGSTGRLIWTSIIQGRAESGLTLTADLQVSIACRVRAIIWFLEIHVGSCSTARKLLHGIKLCCHAREKQSTMLSYSMWRWHPAAAACTS
jgi:hypothetical protein